MQKFSLLDGEGKHPPLCDRPKVVVISDAAHRKQYGLNARLNKKTGEYVFGYPPDDSPAAIELVMAQGNRVAEDWTADEA